jgi:hypothetical protein
VLDSTATTELTIDDARTTIASLELHDTNFAGVALFFGGKSASRIVARAGGSDGSCEIAHGSLLDSICVATNPASAAIRVYGFGATAMVALRNVTAVATAASGQGISIEQFSSAGSTEVSLVNTIARGGVAGADIVATNPYSMTAGLTVSADHANYETVRQVPSELVEDIGPAHQTLAPLFADASKLDFHEQSSSPTIAHGVTDELDGALDVDGQPRVDEHAATDIGADEYFPPPATTTFPTTTTPPPTTTTPATTTPATTTPVMTTPAITTPVTTTPTTALPPTTTTRHRRDTTPPVVSRGSIAPKAFAAVRHHHGARRHVHGRVAVHYTLSEPASVVGAVALKSTGRLVGRTCETQTSENRMRRACTLWIRRGALELSARRGANAITFTGKVAGHALTPGSYRILLVATDPARNTSLPVTMTFRVVADS